MSTLRTDREVSNVSMRCTPVTIPARSLLRGSQRTPPTSPSTSKLLRVDSETRRKCYSVACTTTPPAETPAGANAQGIHFWSQAYWRLCARARTFSLISRNCPACTKPKVLRPHVSLSPRVPRFASSGPRARRRGLCRGLSRRRIRWCASRDRAATLNLRTD